jgi:predicted regulator of Ras-like GTPase activity (Roadblock/LC7/MglB family)
MEEAHRPRKRGQKSNWKNNVEGDLKRLLDKRGVIGSFLVSKNGETVAQVFQDTIKHKESTLMQYAKKTIPLLLGMRNVPLRRTVFETREGSIIFYNMENGVVGCVLDRDYDILSIMLEVRTVGDMISSHLNNGEMDRETHESLLNENREEFRTLNAELLRQIENHYGPAITEQLIHRTVR